MSARLSMTTITRSSPPTRAKFRAARAFYVTCFLGTCFATYALFSHSYWPVVKTEELHLYKRSLNYDAPIHIFSGNDVDVRPFTTEDDECRQVHKVQDQCAYIHAHCPDDEAGFTAYLDLFYCRLSGRLQPLAFIILIAWLGLLFSTIGIAASDFFCIDLNTIAGILGMSESMAGVTFLAFGNGSPDVFSTFAAMSTNSGSLAVGELFGAAGFITAVVAGSMALIRPFHVAKKSFVRDVGFFIVAAAFSMVFLWDGKLHFWECVAMVLYYIFYVAFVVVWHWWIGRRRRRRERDAAVRSHFVLPADEMDGDDEPYHDDPEDAATSSRPSFSRGVSREDWSALESQPQEPFEHLQTNEDEEEEARDRWMSELASNMRLTRPPRSRSRKNTVSAVRPSLVGALEFQAVLKSLQKSRNIQTIPMHSRRFSDDPTFTTQQQQDLLASEDDPGVRPPYEVLVTDESSPLLVRTTEEDTAPLSAPAGRARAVSANDAAALGVDPRLQRLSPVRPPGDLIEVSSEDSGGRSRSQSLLGVPSNSNPPVSPSLHLEPATPRRDAPIRRNRSSSSAHRRNQSSDLLAPPAEGDSWSSRTHHSHSASTSSDLLLPPGAATPSSNQGDYFVAKPISRQGTDESMKDAASPVPRAGRLPRIQIPDHGRRSPGSSRGTSPFPAYRNYPSPSMTASTRSPVSHRAPSIRLPDAEAIGSPETIPADQSAEQEVPRRPGKLAKFWPYRIFPPPGVIIKTLFPTIYHWGDKTWYEKCLGIVAAPSVFCLTVTLPVVEPEKEDDEETARRDLSLDSAKSAHTRRDFSLDSAHSAQSPGAALKGIDSEFYLEAEEMPTGPGAPSVHHPHRINSGGIAGHGNSASVATTTEQHQHGISPMMSAEPQPLDLSAEDESTSQLWNRWLTIIQLFLAPIFIVLAIYIQAPDALPPSWLIRPILISLLISVILLIPLLLTTTPTHRPQPYRIILSLAGFIVSIAWISAIASQVVGALKALAVILNMSHAIMGLTIFAVGNSLGDLVADVTVAKLGYPVMALSACFGGPMLNILLGVGLSGSWIMFRSAEHRQHKHPKKGLKFPSYHIEVSKTLVVSGVTLLVTLVGLLVAVPMNGWVLSRKIGWCLIALWTASTVFNVVIEVTGLWGEFEAVFGAVVSKAIG